MKVKRFDTRCAALVLVMALFVLAVGAHPAWGETYTPTGWDDEKVFTTGPAPGTTTERTYVALDDNDVLDLSGLNVSPNSLRCIYLTGGSPTIIGNPTVVFENVQIVQKNPDAAPEGTANSVNLTNVRISHSNGNASVQDAISVQSGLTIQYQGVCTFSLYTSSTSRSITVKGQEGATLEYTPTSSVNGLSVKPLTFQGGTIISKSTVYAYGRLELIDCTFTVDLSDQNSLASQVGIRAAESSDSNGVDPCIYINNSTVTIKRKKEMSGQISVGTGGIVCTYSSTTSEDSTIEIVDSKVVASTVVGNYGDGNSTHAQASIGNAKTIIIDHSEIDASVVNPSGSLDNEREGGAGIGGFFDSIEIKNDSKVNVSAWLAAGIGTNYIGSSWFITKPSISIADSDVTAMSYYGAGIGVGWIDRNNVAKTPQVDIKISGKSNVKAYSLYGAAIGSGMLGKSAGQVGIGVPLGVETSNPWDETYDEAAAEMQSTPSLVSLLSLAATDGTSMRAASAGDFPDNVGELTISANDAKEEPTIVCESGVYAVSVPVKASKPMMQYTLDEAPDMTMPVNRSSVDGTDSGPGAPSHDLRQGYKSLAFWPVAEGTYTLTYGAGSNPAKLLDVDNSLSAEFSVPKGAGSSNALSTFNVKPEEREQPTGAPNPGDFSFIYTTERIVYPANLVDLYSDEQCSQKIELTDNLISTCIGKTIYARYKNESGTGNECVTPIQVPAYASTPQLESSHVSRTQSSISYASSVPGVEYALLQEGSSEPLQVIAGNGGSITFSGLSANTTYTLKAHVVAEDGPQGHFRSKNATLEVKTQDVAELEQISLDTVQRDYPYTGSGIEFQFTVREESGIKQDDFTVTYYQNGSPMEETALPTETGTYTVLLERSGDATYAAYSQIFAMRILPQATLTLPTDGTKTLVYDGFAVTWDELGVSGSYDKTPAGPDDFSFTVYKVGEQGDHLDSGSAELPTDAGVYEIAITLKEKTIEGSNETFAAATGTLKLTIAQSGSKVTATITGKQPDKDGKYVYTYGDQIQVQVSISATGSAPTAATSQNSLVAPQPGQVALYYRPVDGGDDVQLTEPKDISHDESVTFAYDTSSKLLPTGKDLQLVAKYAGSDDMAQGESSVVPVALDKYELTPTVIGSVSKIYDGTTNVPTRGTEGAENTLGISLGTNFVGTDNPTATATFVYDDANAGNNKNISATNVELDSSSSEWYVLLKNECTGTEVGSIMKRALTVTAPSGSITYGDPKPGLTPTITGFVNEETSSVLIGNPTVTCPYEAGSNAGTYSINVSLEGVSAANYSLPFNVANGTLTVKPRIITVDTSGAAANKVYDESAEAAVTGLKFNNLFGQDGLAEGTDYTVSAKYDNASTGTGKHVTGTVTLTETTAAKNYTFVNSANDPVRIANFELSNGVIAQGATTLTATVDNATPTYGDAITFTVTPKLKTTNNALVLSDEKPTIEISAGDTVLGSAPAVEGQSVTIAYDTAKKGLEIGRNTVTVSVKGLSNLENATTTLSVTVSKHKVVPVWSGFETRTYDGNKSQVTASLTYDDVPTIGAVLNVDSGNVGLAVAGGAETNAGDHTATASLTGDASKWYSIDESLAVQSYVINKAQATEAMKTASKQVSVGGAEGAQVVLTQPDGATFGSPRVEGGSAIAVSNITISGNVLSFDAGESEANSTSTIVVPVTDAINYENYEIKVTVTSNPKAVIEISGVSPDDNLIYDGNRKQGYAGKPAFTPAWTGELIATYYAGETAQGEPLTGAPTDTGTYTVRLSIPDSDRDCTGYVDVTFTVAPALPVVDDAEVAHQNLPSGATVADAVKPTFSDINGQPLDGTFTWYADTEHSRQLADEDALDAGEHALYWVFTPNNGNYSAISGSVTVTVESSYTPPVRPTYPPTISDTEHGEVAVSPARPSSGQTVTITPKPDEGYKVDEVTVTDKDGAPVEVTDNDDNTWSFKQPAGSVTITVTFVCDGGELCPSHRFTDVDQTLWYHTAVDWAVTAGAMSGYDGTDLFGPDDELTRAQMAAVLYNLAGKPEAGAADAFTDLAEGAWYANPVAWAVDQGLFKGYEGTSLFDPDDSLTREQAAAVLMRWAEARGEDVTARADLTSFPDASEVSTWATDCLSWAVGAGVLNGVETADGSRILYPQGTCTRAQLAALLMNWLEG